MRDEQGRFTSGNSGRPLGARNKATRAVQMLLDGEAETLTRKAIELALEGNVTALKICLDRICPVPRTRDLPITLPHIEANTDIVIALKEVMQNTAQGELTPEDARVLIDLYDLFRKRLADAEHAVWTEKFLQCQ